MTKLLFIRPGRPDEREALEALLARAVRAAAEYRGQPAAPAAALRIRPTRIADGRVLVVEGDEGLFGFGVWTQTRDGAAELEGLYIEPRKWRQGMGRRLLEAIAARTGDAALQVTAPAGEERFFAGCGFVRIRRVETKAGGAVRMERRPEAAESIIV